MVGTIAGIVVSAVVVGLLAFIGFKWFNDYASYKQRKNEAGRRGYQFDETFSIKNRVVSFICTLIAGISLIVFMNGFYTVDAGQRGVVLSFGKVNEVVQPGLHFLIPIRDRVILVDVKTQKASAPANAGTKDLQVVETEVALNYHLDENRLGEIYSKVGTDVEGKVIDPRIQEVVKAVVARYSAEELLKMRDMVKKEISNQLRSSISEYHVIVEDTQITNFHFSAAFNQAIEAKQTAEQAALKAENDLKRIEVEAKQTIVEAEAEAEKIRIQAEAIQKQGGKEYVQLKAIEKWDGALPQYMGGNAPIPFIDAASVKK